MPLTVYIEPTPGLRLTGTDVWGGSPGPMFTDNYSNAAQFQAWFQNENPIGSHLTYGEDLSHHTSQTHKPNESWNPATYFESLGIEDPDERRRVWGMMYDTGSLQQYEKRVWNEEEQTRSREIMASTGFTESMLYGIASGLADPVTLAAIVATGGVGFAGGAARSALKVGALGVADIAYQEAVLQGSQTQRSGLETVTAIAAGFGLGGIVGGIGGAFTRRLPNPEKTREQLSKVLQAQAIDEATPRAPVVWEPDGPINIPAAKSDAEEIARINAENAATFLEGGKVARWVGLHKFNSILRLALSKNPFMREWAQRVQSTEGYMPTDFTGTSKRAVAPAGPAIEGMRKEFGGRMFELQGSSYLAWAAHQGQSALEQVVGKNLSEGDVIANNARIGELLMKYDGTEDSLARATTNIDGNVEMDYRWAKKSLDELEELVDDYQQKLYMHGAFRSDFQELVFGSRTKTAAKAQEEIEGIDEGAAKALEDDQVEAEATALARGVEDEGLAKEGEQIGVDLATEDAAIRKDMAKQRQQVNKTLNEMRQRHQRELEDFDASSVAKLAKPIKRSTDSRGQLNTRDQARAKRAMLRKDQRNKIVARHQKELATQEKKFQKALAQRVAKAQKNAETSKRKLQAKVEKARASREKADANVVKRIEKRNADAAAKKKSLEEGIANMRRIEEGDYQYASSLMQRFHGERIYRPQTYNLDEMRTAGVDDFVKTAIAARLSWVNKQLDAGYGSEKEILGWTKEKVALEKGADDASQYKKWSQVFEDLTQDRSFNNNFQGKSYLSGSSQTASNLKKRAYKWDQAMMARFLDNDIQSLFGKHFATVIPEVQLRARGLWDEKDLAKGFAEARRISDLMKKQIAEDETLTPRQKRRRSKRVDSDYAGEVRSMEAMLRTMRNEDYQNNAQWEKELTYWVNAINGMRTLGGVLPASLSDLPMAISKAGAEHAGKAMQAFAGEFERAGLSKKQIGKLMGIFEYGNFSTIQKLTESDEFGLNPSMSSRYLGKAQEMFYHATIIIKWNQTVKEMAAFASSDRIIESALGRKNLSKHDIAWLRRDGWTDERLDAIAKIYNTVGSDGKKYGVQLEGGLYVLDFARIRKDAKTNPALASTLRASDDFATTMNRVADRAVVTPQAGDLPAIVTENSPLFKLLTSLKSFGLASFNKTTLPMAGQMKNGDAGTAGWAMASTFVGTGSYLARQWFYDIEVTDSPQTLFLEGFHRSGMLGLYNQGMQMTQMMTNNFFGLGEKVGLEVPSRYFARGALTDLLGPTAGLIESSAGMANVYSKALSGEQISDQEWNKGWRIMPFNNVFYLRAAAERM